MSGVLPPRVTQDVPAEGDVLVFHGERWVPLPPGTSGRVLTSAGAGALPTWEEPTRPAWPAGLFGPGSDGAVDLDGVNTYAFLSKSGNVYTMTRNVWATNVTVRAGCELVAHYELFVNDTLTIEETAVVRDNGNSASGTTGGLATTGTRLPVSTGSAGVNGRNTTGNGTGGTANTRAYGGAGGAGGAAGVQTGGAGGTVTAPNAANNQLRDGLGYAFVGLLPDNTGFVTANGGASGGSGAAVTGTGTAVSGGGGGGGPVRTLFAKNIVNNGEIQCKGGNGGNATATGDGQAAGGGGGGGGYLLIVSDTPLAEAGTITVAGGTGGTGAGGGANGVNGSSGTLDYRAP